MIYQLDVNLYIMRFSKKSSLTFVLGLCALMIHHNSCKSKKPDNPPKEEEKPTGVVLSPSGEPLEDASVWNLTSLQSTKTGEDGTFRINVEPGDTLLFEKGDLAFMMSISSHPTDKIQVVMYPLRKKVFYLKNFESLQFREEIFIFIPRTRFISPVLSNGMVILTYPEGSTEFFLVSATSFTQIPAEQIKDIPEHGTVDISELVGSLETFSEEAKLIVKNESNTPSENTGGNNSSETDAKANEKIIFEQIPSGVKYEYVVGATAEYDLPAGLYNIEVGTSEIPCVFIRGRNELVISYGPEGDNSTSNTPTYLVKGIASSKYGEGEVLVWIEGTNIFAKSNPSFDLEVPAELVREKRQVFFSRFSLFPMSLPLGEIEGELKVELDFSSFVSGTINSAGKTEIFLTADQTAKQGEYPGIFPLRYSIRGEGKTNFSFYMPADNSFLLTITGISLPSEEEKKSIIPKAVEFTTKEYSIYLGEINLCSEDDQWCIIEDGLKLLEVGKYEEAQNTFSFSTEVSGKIGFIISTINIINRELSISELSGKMKKIVEGDIEEVIREVEGNISGSPELCYERIRVEIPVLLFLIPGITFVRGCVGEATFQFMKAVYTMLKALYKYVSGHKLPPEGIQVSADITSLRELGKKLSDQSLFVFEEYFLPATFISDIKTFFEILKRSIILAEECGSTDEVICEDRGNISLRTPQGKVSFLSKSAMIDEVISSLEGKKNIGITEIVSFFPSEEFASESTSALQFPEFIKLNLRKFLSNPLRVFFPSVLTDSEGNHYLALEIEVPEGYMGEKGRGKFIPPAFFIGDSPHFKLFFPLLEKDGIYPEGGTDYYEDWQNREFIIYFIFDDPSFGGSLKLSPCEVAITQEIWERWKCGENRGKFFTPTNQMFNDVFAVIQKYLGLKLAITGVSFSLF